MFFTFAAEISTAMEYFIAGSSAALHMAAVTAVIPQAQRRASNSVLAAFYEEKRRTKPPQVAMSAVMHKISNIIFAVLRDQKPFELRQPEEHTRRLGIGLPLK